MHLAELRQTAAARALLCGHETSHVALPCSDSSMHPQPDSLPRMLEMSSWSRHAVLSVPVIA
eukprot:2319657-Rhodomonas_salina.1